MQEVEACLEIHGLAVGDSTILSQYHDIHPDLHALYLQPNADGVVLSKNSGLHYALFTSTPSLGMLYAFIATQRDVEVADKVRKSTRPNVMESFVVGSRDSFAKDSTKKDSKKESISKKEFSIKKETATKIEPTKRKEVNKKDPVKKEAVKKPSAFFESSSSSKEQLPLESTTLKEKNVSKKDETAESLKRMFDQDPPAIQNVDDEQLSANELMEKQATRKVVRVKKKRKVEKQEFVQEGKYMRTISKIEWEEYSTDEEAIVRPKVAKQPEMAKKDQSVGKKGSKKGKEKDQRSILSFFSK